MWKGLRKAHHKMAELQFAAGAKSVMPLHHDAEFYSTLKDCKNAIDTLPADIMRHRLLTAHLMGGCAMGEDVKTSVVNSEGRFHHADNLYIIDGSVFPTSIGANPQLSIYALALKQASTLAKRIAKG
jgi:choline dehydrogenase-like flavoprotein